MSDTMLLGVLRMPFEIAMSTLTARIQYHQRGVQAADEIEKRTRERDEARAAISTLEIVGKAADDERAKLFAEIKRLHKAHETACLGGELLRGEVERLHAEHDALRGAAREYLETLGGAMKSGKFQMGGSAEMAHFVRQAMQRLDSLVFDRAGPRPAGLEKLHEPHGRAS